MSPRKLLMLIVCLNGANICILTNLMLGKSVLFWISDMAPTLGIGNLILRFCQFATFVAQMIVFPVIIANC